MPCHSQRDDPTIVHALKFHLARQKMGHRRGSGEASPARTFDGTVGNCPGPARLVPPCGYTLAAIPYTPAAK